VAAIIIILVCAILLAACGIRPANFLAPRAQPAPAPLAAAEAAAVERAALTEASAVLAPVAQSGQNQPSRLPPLLIETLPADGATWHGEPVVFVFDQRMGDASAAALSVEPALAGETTVEDDRIVFTPSEELVPGTRYHFRLDTEAASAAGASLTAAAELSLTAAGPLQVTATQPTSGSLDVAVDTQIVVVFNRPVVPLTGVDEQTNLPQPLTIEPAVEGEGRWLNTSTYLFQPAEALHGSTSYHVVVSGVEGLDGEGLAGPYEFAFTTTAPIVLNATTTEAPPTPDSTFIVVFSQPMDPDSTEAAFSLSRLGDVEPGPVEGEFGWGELGATLYFTPSQPLAFGGRYQLDITTEAQPASQEGNLRLSFTRVFSVVPLPAVLSVSPINGATNVSPEESVFIRFNTWVSPTQVLENVSIAPMLTSTQVYSYYSEYGYELTLSWFKEPQTTYTVTVGKEISDRYGNTLGEDYVSTFTTGDYAGFLRLDLDRFNHFSAFTETNVSLLYRNLDSIEVNLFALPESELRKLAGSNQYQVWEGYQVPDRNQSLIWSRSYEPVEERNITVRQVVSLTTPTGADLAPGIYFMETLGKAAGEEDQISQAVVILTNYNLVVKKSQEGPSMVWLTDLLTGQPAGGQPIRFYADDDLVGEGETGEDGALVTRLALNAERQWTPVLAFSGEPGSPDFAVVSSEWNSGIGIWEFNLSGGWGLEPYTLYFYTDRPIYRPGQTVYWKGIVRRLVGDVYELPPDGLSVAIAVRDDRGNTILEDDVPIGEHGTLNGEVELSPDAFTGYYYLEARLPISPERSVYGGAGFQVASYRKPEFEISVTPEEPDYINGDTVRINVQANYFSGGPLANAPVTWRLISEPYYYTWADAPEGRFYSFTPFDPEQTTYDPYRSIFYSGLIREGVGQTDANGSFVLEMPADISQSPQSQNWVFDFTLQSPTNQFVSGRTSVPIHKGEFYIGLSPQSYVTTAGDESLVDVVTITPDGQPYADADLELTVYEVVWNSVYVRAADGLFRWDATATRSEVYSATVVTDSEGEAVLSWTPAKGGQYQVVASGEDEMGNRLSSSVYVWASTRDPGDLVAWPRENHDRITLVADKTLYEPGDSAHILVPIPFVGPVQALVTLERAGVIESRVVTFTGNSETLEIPITVEQIPNIFVSVLLVKGVDETNPYPAMRLGYAQLNVDTSAKQLAIEVAKSAEQVRPGDTVSYTLTVRDDAGEPAANAELSVALIDKAVLSLAAADNRSLLEVFYYQRPLDVTTGALLVINRDRLSQQLSEGAKGGGGGGDGGLEVRQEFPDSAYWRAALLTDEDGIVQFEVELPDNLTTWRLVVRAVTDDTRVGDAVDDIVATKELQIRPLLPRFFTAGDRPLIGAVLLNTGEEELENGVITLQLEGAALEGPGEPEAAFDLAAGGQFVSAWPIVVEENVASVVITYTAVADIAGTPNTLDDAVRIELPVNRYESPETVSTAGRVPASGVVEAIRLPEDATDNGELNLTLEPSMAAGMLEGLSYLEHYPYECIEQTVSRFLPNLFTVRALRQLNIDNPALEEELASQVNVGIQRLIGRQNPDGGWGYWPGQSSSAFITSYVVWGLGSAQQLGYTVPQGAFENAIIYLDRQFVAPKDVDNQWRLNEMAFMHFILSEIGAGDPGRASTLFDIRERLSLYAKALLAMALQNMTESSANDENAEDERVQILLDELYGAAQISASGAWWDEETIDYRNMTTNLRTTSMVLAAFVRAEPDQPLLPQVVRWLMDAREHGRWSTTQENAWAIIALTDWLEASGELEGDYEWTALLNGSEWGHGVVGPDNLDGQFRLQAAIADLLRDEANLIQINRSNDSGQLYYSTDLQYYLDALDIEARDRGVVVDRRFGARSAEDAVTSAAVGDVISVTVTIVAPADLYHLLVEVPIPAGVEPIDTSLATTSNEFENPEVMRVEEPGQTTSWWWNWIPSATDIRDDKVAMFSTFLRAGTYEYTFQVRASVPGEYRVLPVFAEQMYFPDVWGRSTGAIFTVTD
jgi:uncharacterized protein YfaS (alpha-2-macroglobulin family)